MSPIAARVRLAVACCALLALLPFGSASAQSGGPDAFGTTYSPMTLG